MRRWVLIAALISVARAARADEAQDILGKLRDPDLATRTLGAIAIEHYVRAQYHQPLFDRPALQPWQTALGEAVPVLVEMLSEDRGLEWIDENGNLENTTTPRREAARALLSLERASIDPLIAVLDRKPLARKASDILRLIAKGGPARSDRQSWQQWWAAHAGLALPNERGRWWMVLLGLGVVAMASALAFLFQRRRAPVSLLQPQG
jgi:hypothetical protein